MKRQALWAAVPYTVPVMLGYLFLGAALPSASIAMLVVYCFKNVSAFSGSHGLPELISAVFVIVVHKWRHNLLLSIVGGTVLYMLLVQRLLSF